MSLRPAPSTHAKLLSSIVSSLAGTNSFPYVPNSSSAAAATSSSYRPRSGDYTSAHRPSYVSEIPPPTSVPLQYSSSGGHAHRQGSLAASSLNSHDDYTAPAPWSQSQVPPLTGSRNNSIYSLDGQMGSMAVGPGIGPGVEGHAPISGYGGPPQPQQHRQLAHTMSNVHADRRFSLDDRRAPLTRNGPSGTSTPGRTWPWGGSSSAAMASSNGNGVASAGPAPSSLPSSAPFHTRASYDYGSMGTRSLLPGSNGANLGPHDSAWQSYDSSNLGAAGRGIPLGVDANTPARMRAMSSSAGPSRGHPYATAYGGGSGNASVLFGRPSSPSGEFDHFSSSGSKFKLLPPSQSPSASVPSTIPPGVGPGGGVTRRTKFKRSRTGCLVCRKRKVKCSQDGTPCRQCRIGKRDCYYQEEPRKGSKGKKKGAEERRKSLVSLDGDEEESEEGSDEDEGEGEGASFDDSLMPRGSHHEEQLHNFGGAAPIPRYEPLYSGQAVNHSSHDQHQRAAAPIYDSGGRGGVEFNMPFEGHPAPQHQIHQSPHQHHHQQHQQHYQHPHQATTSSIDTSVRSVGSIGSGGGDSSFDTGGSTGPTSIGSAGAAAMPGGPISGPVPLHKGEDEGRVGGVGGGGGGGWYDPVAAVLRGEDAQSRYF